MKLTKRLNRLVNILFLFVAGILLTTKGYGQLLTLEDCQQKAELLSPLKRQEQYITSLDALNKELVQNNWLPGINLQGRGSYQSAVFKLPFSVPGADVPQIPKNQYQFTVNLNQNIYDGGASRASSFVENAKTEVQAAQLKASLYQIREVINELYFGILTLERSEEINGAVIAELDNQLHRAKSAVKNGVLLTSELKSLQKQKLSTEQQQNELRMRRTALVLVLSDWIGEPITSETELVIPENNSNLETINRPELLIFSKKMEQLQAQQSLIQTKTRPKLAAFGTYGVGQPNPYNFFQTTWHQYYIVGAQLKWTPWDWNSSKKQREILAINEEIVLSEKENFEKNVRNQLIKQQSEIELLASSLTTDKELLDLQRDITETAASQFERGVITATDYLSELNSLTRAELQYNLHMIQLAKAEVTKQNIAGL